ncbi:MAG: EamA family transporter RarD [Synoicihabitans sp.]
MPNLNSPTPEPASVAKRGAIAAFVAYFLWGTLPAYWKMLEGISVVELMAHRILWTLVAVMVFQTVRGRLPAVWATWRVAANRRAHLRGGVMVTINWGVFVWALLNEQVIEASLGYFLVPLLNAGLGRIIFHERLDRLQTIAMVLAAVGVAVLFTEVENMPWVSLGIAASWCTYGVGRKKSDASAINGLALEMTYVAPLALGYLAWLHSRGLGSFGAISGQIDVTIAFTGVMSMIPLVLFAYGTRRLTYTTIGLLQYVAPTCQFLMGWLIFAEPLSQIRVAGFVLIWIGLVCYTVGTVKRNRS